MAQKRKRSKKWISWLIILILLIAAGVVVYLVWDNYFNEKKSIGEQAETNQVEKKQEEKRGVNDGVSDDDDDEKKVKQYEGEDPNKKAELTGVVTYAGVNGDKLTIRVNIDQYVGEGTCGLSLKRGGGDIYNAEARIVDSATTATCEGFDVPLSGLGSGDLAIVIYISSGDKTGEIKGEVRI